MTQIHHNVQISCTSGMPQKGLLASLCQTETAWQGKWFKGTRWLDEICLWSMILTLYLYERSDGASNVMQPNCTSTHYRIPKQTNIYQQ